MADTAGTKAKDKHYTKQACQQKSFSSDQMEIDNVTILKYLESFNEKIVSTVCILKALKSYLFS